MTSTVALVKVDPKAGNSEVHEGGCPPFGQSPTGGATLEEALAEVLSQGG